MYFVHKMIIKLNHLKVDRKTITEDHLRNISIICKSTMALTGLHFILIIIVLDLIQTKNFLVETEDLKKVKI